MATSDHLVNNVLWLITARSGSKSVPDKNIRLLNHIPLLAYRIKSALHLSGTSNIWCSTDSEKYAVIAKEYGAKIPFLRPANLATDTSSSADVILHAMKHAEENGYVFEYIALLEPTSPFVYKDDLLAALRLLVSSKNASCVVAVKNAKPNSVFVQDESEYLDTLAANMALLKGVNRQQQKKQVTPSGGFYISKWKDFQENHTFYTNRTLPYMLTDECSLEIDEEIDWWWATFLIQQGLIDTHRIF